MEQLITYDFTKYLLISIPIGTLLPFLKNEVLKDFSVIELGVIGNLILMVLYFLAYTFYEKKSYKDLLKKDYKKFWIFLIFIVLIFFGLLVDGTILKNEGTVIKYKSFQRSINTVLMLVVGACLFKEKLTFNMGLGVLTIALGLYLFDKR